MAHSGVSGDWCISLSPGEGGSCRRQTTTATKKKAKKQTNVQFEIAIARRTQKLDL